MTRTVSDAALMLRVLSCPDPRDWFAFPYGDKDFLAGLDDGVSGMESFSCRLSRAPVDAEVAALVRRAADDFSALGAQVEEVTLEMPDVGQVFYAHWAVAPPPSWRASRRNRRL